MGVCLPESGGSADPGPALRVEAVLTLGQLPPGGDACTGGMQTYRVGSELGPCPSACVVSR